MSDYYNDFDEGAAAWLRELIAEGHIPAGRVDSRSILDVRPTDLAGVRRANFFAGIAGWSEALRLADWPEWLPTWTGSPPSQPFSAAGKRAGRDDARHLGPAFVGLVRAARPPVLFGEQVASADVFGPAAKPGKRGVARAPAWAWLDDLFDRLEAAGYAAWASDIPAAGVGAPHIRQRCFFCAVDLRFAAGGLGDARRAGDERGGRSCEASGAPGPARGEAPERERCGPADRADGASGGLEHGAGDGRVERRAGTDGRGAAGGCGAGGLADSRCLGWQRRGAGEAGNEPGTQQRSDGLCDAGGMADTDGRERNGVADGEGCQPDGSSAGWVQGDGEPAAHCVAGDWPRPTNGFWGTADWLLCRDGKWRPAEPGIFPLAHGVSGRVGLLRGAGNAIVPQAAAEFIHASRDVMIETGIWGRLRHMFSMEGAA